MSTTTSRTPLKAILHVSFAACALLITFNCARAAEGGSGPAAPAAPAGKIRLLILGGENNYGSKKTLPLLTQMYESSGRFAVTVCEDLSNLKPADFAQYDAVVNDFSGRGAEGKRMAADVEKALLEFLAAGHGFVLYNAAASAWPDWPEYANLVGQKPKSGHTSGISFPATIVNKEHPVTKGLKDFQHVPDEIRQCAKNMLPSGKVLATIGSPGNDPIVIVNEHGKGRVFHCTLGHPMAMKGIGFQTLMLRGTEWAATGQVTIPVPADWSELGGPLAAQIQKDAEAAKAEREVRAKARQEGNKKSG